MINDEKLKIGFALTGSFCTFKKAIEALKEISPLYDIYPIMSHNAYFTDTRFGKAEDFREIIKNETKKDIIYTIEAAEPIGPKNFLDALVIAPCTGNTLSKIALGITDSSVTMSAKASLRNQIPVIISISTNDGLGANAKNIGMLLERKNIFIVPFGQDDPVSKPQSLISDLSLLKDTLLSALDGKQLQPQLI